MSSLVPIAISLAIAGIMSVGMGLCLAGFARAQRRAAAALEQRLADHAHRIEVLERDLGALLSCSRRVGDRLGQGERTQRQLQKQLDKLHFDDDDRVAAEHAMKLLDTGLPLEEVTRLCDLTRGEVEILQNLARHRRAA